MATSRLVDNHHLYHPIQRASKSPPYPPTSPFWSVIHGTDSTHDSAQGALSPEYYRPWPEQFTQNSTCQGDAGRVVDANGSNKAFDDGQGLSFRGADLDIDDLDIDDLAFLNPPFQPHMSGTLAAHHAYSHRIDPYDDNHDRNSADVPSLTPHADDTDHSSAPSQPRTPEPYMYYTAPFHSSCSPQTISSSSSSPGNRSSAALLSPFGPALHINNSTQSKRGRQYSTSQDVHKSFDTLRVVSGRVERMRRKVQRQRMEIRIREEVMREQRSMEVELGQLESESKCLDESRRLLDDEV